MFTEVRNGERSLSFFSGELKFSLMFLIVVSGIFTSSVYSQVTQQYFTQQPSQNLMRNSSVFRQEIARMEITVTRPGKQPLSLTQVPRVQKNDVIRLRLLDEPVNGIKIDQSQWDWTLLVAFINPLHRMVGSGEGREEGQEPSGTVSEEIQFRKRGWYRQYSFVVPYDSQPVFFLYPKPKYRGQIVKLVNSKYEEIRKLGEKTIELANAYSKINTFVNEMQFVLNRNAQMLGYTYNNNQQNGAYNPYGSTYNPYGSTYNPYGSTYNPYGTTTGATANTTNGNNVPLFGLPTVPALNQLVEGLAKSFNIQLPSCWGNGLNYNGGSGYNSSYGSSGSGYNPYGTNYNSGYSGYNSGTSFYGSGFGNNGAVMDFISRSQCVAKSVNLQDFDISITRMWQQGGVFLAAELQRKYPQLAYYINIAAVAIDFIVKVFQKSPLRIVPTIIQSNDPQGGFSNNDSVAGGFGNQFTNNYSNNAANASNNQNLSQNPVRISLYADSQPNEGEFTTAYPVVVHKWEANPDPEVISLYPPVLSESCLHAGVNLLKSTDLNSQWSEDIYSRDFRLVMSSANGFKKEFPLRKNMGLGGWELNISPEDMNQIPKINMALESEITGTRGFNVIKSPKFNLPISIGGNFEITPESQKTFSVGGRRTVTLRNSLGNCRCLQRVIYKPSFGGQFVFENTTDQNSLNNLIYSADGTEVSFDIDTTNFQPGTGTLEVKTYGGETQQVQMGQSTSPSSNNLTLKLYPAPPLISEVKVGRGDREILIKGERLEQLQSVSINGKRATIKNADVFTEKGTGVQPNTTAVQIGSQTPPQLPIQWGGTANQVNTPANSQSSNPAVTNQPATAQPQVAGSEQRIAVFEDANARINSKTIVLELHLEDNRNLHYPNQFMVGIARPTLRANNQNEIEGIFLNQPLPNSQSDQSSEILSKGKNKSQWTGGNASQIDLGSYPIVLINKSALTVAVQNILTDYSFKIENLSVETRIENATANPNELPAVRFDVLDGNNLRLNFTLNPTVNRNMSGRRLQFRIIDRERGYSDWYSIKQTFVRTPQIESVVCSGAMNNQCEVKGRGLDYIAQVSTDGGRNWFPQTADGVLHVQPMADGKTLMRIPSLVDQRLLQIKLRDYPNTEGLTVSNFRFSNTARGGGKN